MLKKSMAKNITKFFGKIAILCVMQFLPALSFAKVFRPIQVILPGNIEGKLITFSPEQKSKGSEAFKLPYAVQTFKDDKEKDTVVFGIGNDSSAFKPFSFFYNGRFEREILERCHMAAGAVSPNDLEVFNSSYLDNTIKKRVLTNSSTEDKQRIFKPYELVNLEGRRIYFFNFITAAYASKLPLKRWAEIEIDDPARALRKIDPILSEEDFTISVMYGDKISADDFCRELEKKKGTHFLINVPINGEKALFSTTSPETSNKKVFKISIESASDRLPILTIIQKNYGQPRATFRMIPLNKYKEPKAKEDYEKLWRSIRQDFNKPLKVIPVANKASSSANRISQKAHAEILRYASNTEVAFMSLPKQISFTESVITTGDVITRFSNDRIIKFKATEGQLKNLFNEIIKDASISEISASGCNFLILGNNFWNFSINHQSNIDKYKLFRVATTEETLENSSVKRMIGSCIIEDYDGLTLWEAWKNNLRTFIANDDRLFDD